MNINLLGVRQSLRYGCVCICERETNHNNDLASFSSYKRATIKNESCHIRHYSQRRSNQLMLVLVIDTFRYRVSFQLKKELLYIEDMNVFSDRDVDSFLGCLDQCSDKKQRTLQPRTQYCTIPRCDNHTRFKWSSRLYVPRYVIFLPTKAMLRIQVGPRDLAFTLPGTIMYCYSTVPRFPRY